MATAFANLFSQPDYLKQQLSAHLHLFPSALETRPALVVIILLNHMLVSLFIILQSFCFAGCFLFQHSVHPTLQLELLHSSILSVASPPWTLLSYRLPLFLKLRDGQNSFSFCHNDRAGIVRTISRPCDSNIR